MDAYKCCIEASQNTICIRSREDDGDVYTFCSPDSADGECSLSANYFLSFDADDIESACNNINSTIDDAQNGFTVNAGDDYFY